MQRSGTIDKALSVLEALRRSGDFVALGELAARVGMPKGTLHRLLASLSAHELVEQDAEGRYGLGVGLVRLGLSAQSVDPIVRIARPELERAVRAFGETFFLVTARAGRLVVLDKVESSGVLRAAPNVGAEVPVETTASGRLYLGLSPGSLDVSEHKRRAVRDLVQRACERGYDTNEGEWIVGLTVVAAPILEGKRLWGTVASAGAAQQLTDERLSALIRGTREAASRIGAALCGPREGQS
jgi:IclR family acetate operon transcriptional repressor